MSAQTVLYTDASHYALLGGEISSVAAIVVADQNGAVCHAEVLRDVGSDAAERQAVHEALRIAVDIPQRVEIRTDSAGTAKALGAHGDARVAVVWVPRRDNQADRHARAMLRVAVRALQREGYRVRDSIEEQGHAGKRWRRREAQREVESAAAERRDSILVDAGWKEPVRDFDPWRGRRP